MGGLQDPHQEAMLQTENRFPNNAPPDPPEFRRKQTRAFAVIAVLVLVAVAAILFLR